MPDEARGRTGIYLLRVALAGGLFNIGLFLVSMSPRPGADRSVIEVLHALFEVSLVVGLVAPILAITGAIILLVKKRRFGVVDWLSLAIGVVVLLLPVMFVLAYSNCPNRIC
jgi:hypothetical protein